MRAEFYYPSFPPTHSFIRDLQVTGEVVYMRAKFHKQTQYRNRNRKIKRGKLLSYNSQTQRNLRNNNGREIVDEEGVNREINGRETIVKNTRTFQSC